MKKILFPALVLALAALCACTSPSRKAADASVAKMEKQCPVQVDGYGILTDVKVDGNSVVYTFDGEDSPFDADGLKKSPDVASKAAASMLSHSAMQSELKTIAKADMALTVILKDGDDTVEVNFPVEEVKAMAENVNTDHQLDEDMLAARLKLIMSEMPEDFADDIDVVSVTDDGDYIIYDCQMEDGKTVDMVRENRMDVEESMYTRLNTPKALSQFTLERKLRKGMKFNFKDAKNGTYTIEYVFGPYEKKHAPAKDKTPANKLKVDFPD